MLSKLALAGALLATVLLPGTGRAGTAADGCAAPWVPGAEKQVGACLTDLTTTGTVSSGHTVPGDWAGLTSAGLPRPGAVPGVQIDGYFPDSSTTNAHHGWAHDAQFVLRLPERWNGGLVVAGSPGNRAQYAGDRAIADHVLADGYAYAATDKGNTGLEFFADGDRPGDAVAEWNHRVTQLTVAAKLAVTQRYGRFPQRTLMAGISNGGYLVRWQLENRAWLYDGGVDWEGTLWTADGPNLFTFLPAAVRNYPAYSAGSAEAHQAILDAGFPSGSEFLWPYHDQVYWGLTQRIYRTEFDPEYRGSDADYDYANRPGRVHRAVERVALTGRIGKPLITLHGTLDALLPISRDSDVYAGMTGDRPHRYYRIDGGTHADALYDAHPDRLRPIGPCFLSAFEAMGGWLDGHRPPPSRTVPRVEGVDLATTCEL
ncbi:tannase/feruloyl esterase family alpha/beta hydrolase [Amycolatopsis sp. YIM 10]|uniref:tannase/feruloyl esterase family alpha/beta hydrolase n=1 Tax=Amycolatopsis sp. YIM 10 TaxID=2653857 RepID=UPI0018834C0C